MDNELELEDVQQTFVQCLEQELEFILENCNSEVEDIFEQLDAAVAQLRENHWNAIP